MIMESKKCKKNVKISLQTRLNIFFIVYFDK